MITVGALRFLVFLCLCKVIVSEENIVQLAEIISPIHYRVTLLPILERDPRLCGHVWVDFVAQMSTTMLVLHASDLSVMRVVTFPLVTNQSIYQEDDQQMVEDLCFAAQAASSRDSNEVEDGDRKNGDLTDVFFQDNQQELMTVLLKEPMERGTKYRIGILYTGQVQESTVGLFRTQYSSDAIDGNCCKRNIAATQLEPIHARKMFPCLDEPSHKATFELVVGHSSVNTALSNMPLRHSVAMKTFENWNWDVFYKTPLMSTYLVAFVVMNDFDFMQTSYRSMNGRNVTIKLWTKKENLQHLHFAHELVPRILMKLEQYLRVPYSLPKVDLIAVPGYEEGKAMENWGLIVHSEDNLLLSENETTTVDKALVAVTITHELTHQWFGNLVTSKWWDDIWVNEGLTTLFENIIVNQLAPELESDAIFILFLEAVMKSDVIGFAPPLNQPVHKFDSIENKFDAVTYAKGGAIFRMVKSFIGEEAFQSAITRYLKQYQFKNANSTELWNLMNQEARRKQTISCRMNVARVMKTWTTQSGYPLVSVNVNRQNGVVTLSQKPFQDTSDTTTDNSTGKANVSASWWIPITMTDSESLLFEPNSSVPTVWLSPRRQLVEVEGPKNNKSWILVNVESNGYYRVNYDQHNWQLLAKQLLENHTVIPMITRAQLIDDAFTLGHSKIISYEIASGLIEYLDNIDDNLIRKIAKRHVESIKELDELEDSNELGEIEIVERMLVPVTRPNKRLLAGRSIFADSMRFSDSLVDGNCDADDEMCVSVALQLFGALVNNTITEKEQEMIRNHFHSVWCSALRHGGKMEWDFAWKKSINCIQPLERRKMLKAMTCTIDAAHVNQLLSRVFNPNVDQTPQETSIIISRFSESFSIRPLVMSFLIKNWKFLSRHFSDQSELLYHLISITEHSITAEDFEKIKEFLAENSTLISKNHADKIIRNMQRNIRKRTSVHRGNASLKDQYEIINDNKYDKNPR